MQAAVARLKQQRINSLFIGGFLGQPDSVVESFLDAWPQLLPCYTVEDDGGSVGGFSGDAVGGAGGAPDKTGRNSGGMKPTQTS